MMDVLGIILAVGYNPLKDRERYFVSEGGVVVIPRGQPKSAWLLSSS